MFDKKITVVITSYNSEKYLKDCLDYMKITKKKFLEIIDKARPAHLWKRRLGKWMLREPIWKQK